MKFKNKIQPKGLLTLYAFDRHGRELWRDIGKNLIVQNGYKAIVEALAGVAGASIKSVAVGDNGTIPIETDTEITNPVIVDMQSVTYPSVGVVRFTFTIGYDKAVGMEIREFGLITVDGRLFSRKVREAIEKTQYMSIVGQWDITI